jgi:hypothetical protein
MTRNGELVVAGFTCYAFCAGAAMNSRTWNGVYPESFTVLAIEGVIAFLISSETGFLRQESDMMAIS